METDDQNSMTLLSDIIRTPHTLTKDETITFYPPKVSLPPGSTPHIHSFTAQAIIYFRYYLKSHARKTKESGETGLTRYATTSNLSPSFLKTPSALLAEEEKEIEGAITSAALCELGRSYALFLLYFQPVLGKGRSRAFFDVVSTFGNISGSKST